MIKKITTKTHTFLVDEEEAKGHEDAIYGKALLLSVYVGFNKKSNSKSGSYYFSTDSNRVALRSNVISEEEPTEKEKEFYELLKKESELSYSTSLAKKYGINKFIRCYFVERKTKEEKEEEKKKELLYPRCKVYYDYSLLEK